MKDKNNLSTLESTKIKARIGRISKLLNLSNEFIMTMLKHDSSSLFLLFGALYGKVVSNT